MVEGFCGAYGEKIQILLGFLGGEEKGCVGR